jgi:hypothetical protein
MSPLLKGAESVIAVAKAEAQKLQAQGGVMQAVTATAVQEEGR